MSQVANTRLTLSFFGQLTTRRLWRKEHLVKMVVLCGGFGFEGTRKFECMPLTFLPTLSPWHGACWKAATGDIEDAPGLDALASYKVSVKGGKVFVEADEDLLKEGRRLPKVCKKDNSVKTNVVVLGGGAAGEVAVEGLREAGYAGNITLISREKNLPIDR